MGTTALLIMGGGALGALLRFILDRTLLSVQLDSAAKGKRVPAFSTGILFANLFGSFLLGLFTVALSVGVMSDNGYAIWGVGLCGAFTTFSTFSSDVVRMLKSGDYTAAGLCVALNFAVCVCCILLGTALGRLLKR